MCPEPQVIADGRPAELDSNDRDKLDTVREVNTQGSRDRTALVLMAGHIPDL